MTELVHDNGAERGSVSAFVVGLVLALIVVAGLVFDGSLLAAHREADAEAEGAARAAAEQISGHDIHTGTVGLDPAAARTAAERYLTPYHHPGTVTITGDQVTVTVTIAVPMQILSIAGVTARTVAGTGTATAVEGTVTPTQP